MNFLFSTACLHHILIIYVITVKKNLLPKLPSMFLIEKSISSEIMELLAKLLSFSFIPYSWSINSLF